MQSAGFTETRSHPPIQNLAKVPKLRCQAEQPHFVYSLLAGVRYLILSINILFLLLALSSNVEYFITSV